ncbi:MAG: PEFG-CTERM sorting domain-containing protein [Nitrosotalea sp.]
MTSPPVFAQYQYGGDQARIIFLSSNSTQVTASSSSPNSALSITGYSNSTQATVTSSSNPTPTTAALKSPNTVPEFGSIAPIILAISVIGIVVLAAKTRTLKL